MIPARSARTAGYMPVAGMAKTPTALPAAQTGKTAKAENAGKSAEKSYESRTAGLARMNANNTGDFSFADLIDIINPLHHIPIVGSFYRSATGDEIKPAARALGGFLFGGPIGLVAGLLNGIIAGATGKDIPQNIMTAAASGKSRKTPSDEEVMLAAAQSRAAHQNSFLARQSFTRNA
ncbi:MAG: hypothetical protein EA357_10825 [Micavibrio sp.]|nr:MAG: hypothetical protein EA357_10825 [Micavibrio sp.]